MHTDKITMTFESFNTRENIKTHLRLGNKPITEKRNPELPQSILESSCCSKTGRAFNFCEMKAGIFPSYNCFQYDINKNGFENLEMFLYISFQFLIC